MGRLGGEEWEEEQFIDRKSVRRQRGVTRLEDAVSTE